MVMQSFMEALQSFAHLEIWLLLVSGGVIGLILGIIPGVGALIGMSLLLPFVFLMSPDQALPLFIAIAATGYTGGAVTAILLNIPGTAPNAATLLDGFPMTQKGEGSRALGAALMASGMGGVVSVIFALIMVPMILPMVFALRSAELVLLILLGLSFIAVLSRESVIKGLISGGTGILLSLIGLHIMTSVPRFTFGTIYLLDGIPLVPMTLGVYAIPEMIALAVRGGTIVQLDKVMLNWRGTLEGMKDVFRHWFLWLRSSVIGYIIGIIPGIGAMTSIFVAYGHAKQTSKHPELFGTGIVEGVIAPESANNSKEGGALLTTLALGIPGSAEMVIFLGALMMLGITPGPDMMTLYLPLTFKLLLILFAGSILGAAICIALAQHLAKIAIIPARILVPIVTIVVFIGSFAYGERVLNLVVLLIFGFIGLAMRKYGFNRSALILGFVLGGLFEKYLFIAYGTEGPLFFTRPISLAIVGIIVALYLYAPLRNLLSRISRPGSSKP